MASCFWQAALVRLNWVSVSRLLTERAQIVDKLLYVAPHMSAVPLPAAGWMLIAGLGGLAAMKRRKKA